MKLQNEKIILEFSDFDGQLVSVSNPKTGRRYFNATGEAGYVFKLDTGTRDLWESRPDNPTTIDVPATGNKASFDLKNDEEKQVLTIRQNVQAQDSGYIAFEQKITLPHDCGDATFAVSFTNNTNGVVVSVRMLPIEGVLGDEASLFWPMRYGCLYRRVFEDRPQGRHDCFNRNPLDQFEDVRNASEERRIDPYPCPMFLQCYALDYGTESLYWGIHDKEVAYKQFVVERARRIFVNEYPFCEPEKSYAFAPVILGIKEGDWHKCADFYRQFLVNESGLMRKRRPAGTNIHSMNCIKVSSYPDIHHLRYTNEVEYPTEIAACDFKTRDANFDSLGIGRMSSLENVSKYSHENSGTTHNCFIGWSRFGLDKNYPDYELIDELGGKEGLKKGLDAIHKNGEKAIFYVNVHIADANGKWSQQEHASGVKNYEYAAIVKGDGSYIRESYDTSTSRFIAMCPMADVWQDALVAAMRKTRECGGDGIYFDQLSEMTIAMCYNRAHGHSTPATAYREGYKKMMEKIYAMLEEYGDDYFCSCEGGADAYMPYVDIFGQNWRRRYDSSERPTMQPEIIRYSLPTDLWGMNGYGETGENLGGRAFSLNQPPLTCPSTYALTKRYTDLCKKYPEIYDEGTFMDKIGLSEVPENVKMSITLSKNKDGAAIHLYNRFIEETSFSITVDPAALGVNSTSVKMYDAETDALLATGNSVTYTLKGKEKKAIYIKF